jgi:hypothetical protein
VAGCTLCGKQILNLLESPPRSQITQKRLAGDSTTGAKQWLQFWLAVMAGWCSGMAATWFEAQLCHLSAVKIWTTHFTYVNPVFLFWQRVMMIATGS